MPKMKDANMFPRVDNPTHVPGHQHEQTYADGERAEVDLGDMIAGGGGLLAELENVEVFAKVHVDREAGTVVWPNGVDFCPVVLYAMATGRPTPEPEPAASPA